MSDCELRYIDVHLGRFLGRRSGFGDKDRDRFETLVQRLSLSLADGHSCLRVDDQEVRFLQDCPVVSAGERVMPLVLWGHRLYFQRYFQYEKDLAEDLRQRASQWQDAAHFESRIAEMFPRAEEAPQRAAARLALERQLCVISGGPGTGKTTTVVAILALLLEMLGPETSIALAAPTGKAAMRLQESIRASRDRLNVASQLKEQIPISALTLHRLLGARGGTIRLRHHRNRPLPWDVVVIDEASMVDLAMMTKVVAALKPGSKLLLLGDKDQLASVESGAVLAECIEGLAENTVELLKTWRFSGSIKCLATSIKNGQGEKCWEILHDPAHGDVSSLSTDVLPYITAKYAEYMAVAREFPRKSGAEVFATLGAFQVLCAVRQGPQGVVTVNRQVEYALQQQGFPVQPGEWYHGRPVMVTRNDYAMQLYNGDIGICLADPEDGGRLKVWFEQPEGGLRCCSPLRLQDIETVYAMTIHKSQGSEFAEVLMLLPETMHQVLNRQLVYTAVTRAKKKVRVAAEHDILVETISRNYARSSGLAALLLSPV